MAYDPNQPRVPSGVPEGGQWTASQLVIMDREARSVSGLPQQVVGVAWGKRIASKHYGASADRYGLAEDEKQRPGQEQLLEQMDKMEADQEAKTGTITAYETYDHTKSHSLEPNAGFPPDHQLADPKVRVKLVNEAAQALSYSNMVGYGGALKLASQGNTTDSLYKYFARREYQGPPPTTLEDILQAMQKETEGLLRENGIQELVLYHGTQTEFGRSNAKMGYKPFVLSDHYRGISSWTNDPSIAAQFGKYIVRAVVPAANILSVPAYMPLQLTGVPVFLGGSRMEGEFIVRVP